MVSLALCRTPLVSALFWHGFIFVLWIFFSDETSMSPKLLFASSLILIIFHWHQISVASRGILSNGWCARPEREQSAHFARARARARTFLVSAPSRPDPLPIGASPLGDATTPWRPSHSAAEAGRRRETRVLAQVGTARAMSARQLAPVSRKRIVRMCRPPPVIA